MKSLKRIFIRLWRLVVAPKPSRPEDIPKKLDAQALHQAMQEAKFLHQSHAVSVKPLAPDELPGLPKKADD